MAVDLSQFALTDKVALVTGGGQGIGLAIALGMAKAGADVVVTSRNTANIEKAAEQIRGLGRRSLAVPCDVSERDQIRQVVDRTFHEFGRIDILVNNAGISPLVQPAETITDEQWDHILRVNMEGTANFCRYVGEIMVKQKSGAIVNIASIGGPVAIPNLAPYCQSKAAAVGLTKVLAAEWAKHNVRVNAIAPAWIKSPMNVHIRSNPDFKGFIQKEVIDKTPLGRWGEDYEVANAAIFLASPAASYITGDTLFVDGGQSAI
ncbi:MAG: glucose 1-dehydrogenase [Candidatus Marsarchaeota archaeon]|nr:glucose 1-dehydrogenase [Candidatus Marsarchaeota archaeon]